MEYSIFLISGTKIDVTEAELRAAIDAINVKTSTILIGNKGFAYHQFSYFLPRKEADFKEKMELRIKGYWRCSKYGTIHKLGDRCDCSHTGEINPELLPTIRQLPNQT